MEDERKGSVFRTCPLKEQILEWLQRLKIVDFEDSHIVTESAFDFDEFNMILLELEPYYYPCKMIYLHRDMNMKRALTVLRQMVKPYGYTFNTRERLIAGNKINEYWLMPESADGNKILNPLKCQITFT